MNTFEDSYARALNDAREKQIAPFKATFAAAPAVGIAVANVTQFPTRPQTLPPAPRAPQPRPPVREPVRRAANLDGIRLTKLIVGGAGDDLLRKVRL